MIPEEVLKTLTFKQIIHLFAACNIPYYEYTSYECDTNIPCHTIRIEYPVTSNNCPVHIFFDTRGRVSSISDY